MLPQRLILDTVGVLGGISTLDAILAQRIYKRTKTLFKNLFVKHPIQSIAGTNAGDRDGSSAPTLKRTLTAKHLVALGIGCIIGAGIFVVTGTAAAQYAGPALILSFVLAGLTCGLTGLCYAEFASMLPVSGSAYTYAYATLGEVIAWFIGWNLVLEYLFSSATVAVGWSGYFNELMRILSAWIGVDISLPAALTAAPFKIDAAGHLVATGALFNLPAVLLVVGISCLLYRGITRSATFNSIIVVVKLLVIVLFLVGTFHFINPSLWHPFIPANEGGNAYGWPGIFRGASLVFFAYIGFDAVSTAAGEAKNPTRDLPIGILGSLLICTVLYILMSAALTGLAPFRTLGTNEPVATALNYVLSIVPAGSTGSHILAVLKVLVVFGALAGLSSVVLVLLMGQPRIFMSIAQDGLLPETLGRVHAKYRTPYVGTIVVGTISALLSGLLSLDVLGDLVSMGTLLAFATVCVGVLVLRRTHPELPRLFRVPYPQIICPLGAMAALFLFWQVFTQRWYLIVGWSVIGFLIYGFYGYRHSKLR